MGAQDTPFETGGVPIGLVRPLSPEDRKAARRMLARLAQHDREGYRTACDALDLAPTGDTA